MHIEIDDPERPDVLALLDEHLRHMHELSPPESVHALDVSGLKSPAITFWSARVRGELVGCGALKELAPDHGEIKSMRTPTALRRQGAGRALLQHILGEARRRGYRRLSLETGPASTFGAAHRLYQSVGFRECGPFGDYRPDPHSVFMTLALDGGGVATPDPDPALDIPRIFNITEAEHRIHNPFTAEQYAILGAALRLAPGARVLDLGSGSGEMLCTWARDHGIVGTGIDMSALFTRQAQARAVELGVANRLSFIHGDAAGHVADQPADVAACVGATWIGGGHAGTMALLARSLRPGGIMLIGEPYWRQWPPTEEVAQGCLARTRADFLPLPELLASFGTLGYDVVEMVLAHQGGWDRYEAAKWLTMRRWLEANPGDPLAETVQAQLASEPRRHVAYTREYLGWGVFALMPRFDLAKARAAMQAGAAEPMRAPG